MFTGVSGLPAVRTNQIPPQQPEADLTVSSGLRPELNQTPACSCFLSSAAETELTLVSKSSSELAAYIDEACRSDCSIFHTELSC